MSILRYPLVAALLALFLGGLATAPAGTDATDGNPPAASDTRDTKDSARRDEAAPAKPAPEATDSPAK